MILNTHDLIIIIAHRFDSHQHGGEFRHGGELRQVGCDSRRTDGVAVGTGTAGVRRVENQVDRALDQLDDVLADAALRMVGVDRPSPGSESIRTLILSTILESMP